MKNIYLLNQADLKKMRKLTRLLACAIIELIELKKVTTPGDVGREYYPPAESDLIEERSFLEYQLKLNFPDTENF
jgi:hypothetical protein